jgi:hypothetical protein
VLVCLFARFRVGLSFACCDQIKHGLDHIQVVYSLNLNDKGGADFCLPASLT